MIRILCLLLIGCILSNAAFSRVKTPVSNANNGWSVASNWLPTGVPANGDTIIIPASFTLSVNGNIYNSGKPRLVIYVYGTLDFDPSGKIDLLDESEVYLFNGGSINTHGSGSERIVINGKTKFNGQIDGNMSGPLFANASTGESPYGFIELIVLPVKLVGFSQEIKNKNLLLQWTMLQDASSGSYDLERKFNAEDWKVIQTFTLSERAGEMHSKSFEDHNLVVNGVYTYRLKFQDANGMLQYSKTVIVNVDHQTKSIKVFPNPVHSVFEIISDKPVQKGHISLANTSGKIVYETTFTGLKTSIDISHLPKGLYNLLYEGDNERFIKSIMIR